MKAISVVLAGGTPLNVSVRGPRDRRVLALTVDDFPGSGADRPGSGAMALLDLLGELAIPATFFAIGERVRQHPAMLARAANAGHELGNHMARDQWSLALGRETFVQQRDDTTAAIEDDVAAAGTRAPLRWFRPGGAGSTLRGCAGPAPSATARLWARSGRSMV
jgi:peptidoglycan/xylan/chitin deacetylase (PgdA/CDA1 family)